MPHQIVIQLLPLLHFWRPFIKASFRGMPGYKIVDVSTLTMTRWFLTLKSTFIQGLDLTYIPLDTKIIILYRTKHQNIVIITFLMAVIRAILRAMNVQYHRLFHFDHYQMVYNSQKYSLIWYLDSRSIHVQAGTKIMILHQVVGKILTL